MIVEIKYKDKINWESVSGKVTNWTNYSKKFKDESVKPYYVAPEVVTDIWGGIERDIQHTRWNSYYFEMFIKGSEIDAINTLKSCSEIYIIEYNETSSGVVINKSYELDLTKSDLLIINEPEQMSTTDSWKVSIIFRTERTIINKTPVVDYTNNLKIESLTNSDEYRIFNKSVDTSGNIKSICKLTSTRIALYDFNLEELTAYDFNGVNYVPVGNPFTLPGLATSVSIYYLNSTSVVIFERTFYTMGTYSFDGTDWSLVGNKRVIFTDSYHITSLSDTTISFSSIDASPIQAFEFDGTDWLNLGNSYSIIGATSIITAKLSSTSIALLANGLGYLQAFEFDGTDWTTLGNPYTIGSGIIYTLSDTTILYKSGNIIKTISFDGTDWVDLNIDYDFTYSGLLATLNSTDLVYSGTLGNNTLTAYTIGNVYYYFSDIPVLDYSLATESLKISWYDGTSKKFQSTSKVGYQIVFYLSYSDSVEFQKLLNSSDVTSINDIEINEILIEPIPLASDLIKIIVSGISEVIQNNFDIAKNNTYNLKIINDAITYNYYTDYLPIFISESPIISTYDNSGGVNFPVKRITKEVKQVRFYMNRADAFELKKRFELFGTVTLDTIPVIEAREVTPNELGNDRYEVLVNCLISTTLDY